MPTTVDDDVLEGSTLKLSLSFTDEASLAVVPNSGLHWTLSDRAGNIVNSRSDVALTASNPATIVLHGADLAVSESFRDNQRIVTIEGTYNSSAGSNLELVDWVFFEITPSPIV